MITRTTTPTQTLEFTPGTLSAATQIWVMYKQGEHRKTLKWYGNESEDNIGNVEVKEDTIIVSFTQEDTKLFKGALKAHVKVKFMNDDGAVMSSEDCVFDICEIWDDDIMIESEDEDQ